MLRQSQCYLMPPPGEACSAGELPLELWERVLLCLLVLPAPERGSLDLGKLQCLFLVLRAGDCHSVVASSLTATGLRPGERTQHMRITAASKQLGNAAISTITRTDRLVASDKSRWKLMLIVYKDAGSSCSWPLHGAQS